MIKKEKNTYSIGGRLVLGALVLMTAVSGAILASDKTTAAEEKAGATVRVNSACTFSGEVSSEHTASILNGIYQDNIGTTTLTANCNDSNGYAIYAVGFSNDTLGNNNMIGVTTGKTFATGTTTTGADSAWAMKVTPVGTTGPTIEGGFNNYSAVPSAYTKVASQAGATDTTAGSSVTTTYGVYVSGSQAADTYVGQVKYSLVHPSTTTAPTE